MLKQALSYNMASGDSNQFFQFFLTNLFWREEIYQLGLYKSEENIHKHLHQVKEKINSLEVPNDKKSSFLIKTLHQDVLYELATIKDYETNKNNFEWMIKKLEENFGKKQSKVSSYSNFLKIKQLPGQSTRSFLSSVRVHCQKEFVDQQSNERENCLLMAFINGLANKSARKILEELKPKNVEEAFSLIKDEKFETNNVDQHIYAFQEEKRICSCHKTIDSLLEKIDHLERSV